MPLRQQAEKLAQARQILLQERRQLKQHRAALGAECRQIAVENGDRIGRRVRFQPRLMRNAPRRLDREPEVRRRCLCPSLEHVGLGHAIEGVVDLDGRQAFRVPREHRLRFDVLRIEVSLPFLVGKAACTCQEPRS